VFSELDMWVDVGDLKESGRWCKFVFHLHRHPTLLAVERGASFTGPWPSHTWVTRADHEIMALAVR